jgi:hypothetical protein
MAEMWEVVAPVDQIPVLLDPRRRINSSVVDDLDSWNTCPIDNMKHNSCFHLPGVTDGPAPLNQ